MFLIEDHLHFKVWYNLEKKSLNACCVYLVSIDMLLSACTSFIYLIWPFYVCFSGTVLCSMNTVFHSWIKPSLLLWQEITDKLCLQINIHHKVNCFSNIFLDLQEKRIPFIWCTLWMCYYLNRNSGYICSTPRALLVSFVNSRLPHFLPLIFHLFSHVAVCLCRSHRSVRYCMVHNCCVLLWITLCFSASFKVFRMHVGSRGWNGHKLTFTHPIVNTNFKILQIFEFFHSNISVL